jgi:formylglycine-generating enzyme required for sulfatase activity
MPDYPDTTELRDAGGSRYPVSFVTWPEARAYCRFMGKDLPTLDQWERALRGGLTVGGAPNPAPRRTFAWSGAFIAGAAAVPDDPSRRHPVPVGTLPRDTSPDGVADLTGNLQEWILAAPPADGADVASTDERARAAAWRPAGRFRIMRGCNWNDLECAGGASAVDFAALPNQRPHDLRNFYLGFRCRLTSPR